MDFNAISQRRFQVTTAQGTSVTCNPRMRLKASTLNTSTWVRRAIASAIALAVLFGLWLMIVVVLDGVGIGFWSIGERYPLPQARYCFASDLSLEQLVSQLDPLMKRGGYPYQRYKVNNEWYANEATGNGATRDNIEVRISTKTPTSRGEYQLILTQWPKRFVKGDVFAKEAWRHWADLKPLVEGGTGLVLGVAKHPVFLHSLDGGYGGGA